MVIAAVFKICVLKKSQLTHNNSVLAGKPSTDIRVKPNTMKLSHIDLFMKYSSIRFLS